MEKARLLARKSTMCQKHGAVIVRNGKIIAEGYNHLVPYFHHQRSIHAEIDALLKVSNLGKKELSACDIYVVRIATTDSNIFRLSKPCQNCAKALFDKNIRNIYYSTDNEEYSCKIIYSNKKNTNTSDNLKDFHKQTKKQRKKPRKKPRKIN
jgi:deoxycytidylate deaminase